VFNWIAVAITAVLVVGWVPVGIYFWLSWRRRGAPLSLAICGLVGFPIYTNASTFLFLRNDPQWIAGILAGANALILGNFYLCFKWQSKAFPNARRAPTNNNGRRKDFEEEDTGDFNLPS